MRKYTARPSQFLMQGFTLIELIVVLAIIGILTAGGLAAYSAYNSTQLMKTAQAELVDMLTVAKSRSISQVTPPECNNQPVSVYQVSMSIALSAYGLQVVCGGTTYTLQTKHLPTQVNFDAGSLNQAIFAVSTGTISRAGTISFSGYNQTKRIIVQTSGNIVVEK